VAHSQKVGVVGGSKVPQMWQVSQYPGPTPLQVAQDEKQIGHPDATTQAQEPSAPFNPGGVVQDRHSVLNGPLQVRQLRSHLLQTFNTVLKYIPGIQLQLPKGGGLNCAYLRQEVQCVTSPELQVLQEG